jgi:hypothetical protein
VDPGPSDRPRVGIPTSCTMLYGPSRPPPTGWSISRCSGRCRTRPADS